MLSACGRLRLYSPARASACVSRHLDAAPADATEPADLPFVRQPRRLLAAWDEAQVKGLGAVQLDGRMIDRPIAERARRLIDQAEAIAAA